jgi:L-ascorbate 6-phosphate lactonase
MASYLGKNLIHQMDTLTVQPNCMAIWGLGQMGLAVKISDGRILYIDPVLTDVVATKIPKVADKFTRSFPAPLKPEEITNASFVLCSHEHLDHTDPFTLAPLAKASPQAKFVTSGWVKELLDEAAIPLERRIVPTFGQPLDLNGIKISIIPAAHDEIEFDSSKGFRFLSFQIEWGGIRLFHSGDTRVTSEYLTHLHTLPSADVALVAANGRDEYRKSLDVLGNLHPAEVVWLAKEMGWDVVIGGHNDLFEWNTIAAGSLANAVHKYNPRQKYRCQLQPGELFYYVK